MPPKWQMAQLAFSESLMSHRAAPSRLNHAGVDLWRCRGSDPPNRVVFSFNSRPQMHRRRATLRVQRTRRCVPAASARATTIADLRCNWDRSRRSIGERSALSPSPNRSCQTADNRLSPTPTYKPKLSPLYPDNYLHPATISCCATGSRRTPCAAAELCHCRGGSYE